MGYVGLRLPRQADGLWEAVLEDSSGWMVLGSRDWLVMVTCPLLVMVSLSKWVGMSMALMGMLLRAWVSDIMGGLFSIYGA